RQSNPTEANSALSALEKGARWQRTLALLKVLAHWSVEIDCIACNVAIMSCRQMRKWREAFSTLKTTVMTAIEPTVVTMNSLLSACDAAQRWRRALFLAPLGDEVGVNSAASAASGPAWCHSLALTAGGDVGTLVTSSSLGLAWQAGLLLLQDADTFSSSYQSLFWGARQQAPGHWAPPLLQQLALKTAAAMQRARKSTVTGPWDGMAADAMNFRTEANGLRIRRKGGILITEDELKVAWEFFDTNGKGKLTMSEIKRRLQTFYKDITTREVKFLLNNQPEISFDARMPGTGTKSWQLVRAA
ncbi:unnamed protein product, partial [Effrenium voratum]